MSAGQRPPNPTDNRYFTIPGYGAIVRRGLDLGYRLIPFREVEESHDTPVIILRHDLDHALQGVDRMAELETDLGVRATYFVQTTCEFYNLLSRSGRDLVARISELGHEIGLHYESHRYVGPVGERILRQDIRLLEDLSGQTVVSAAQHLPSDQDPIDILSVVENEAYEPRFTESPMHYISDSLMVWRQATPHDLLDQGVSFQFLTHPETWLGAGEDIFKTLAGMRDRDVREVREKYDALSEYYRHLLDNRDSRDRAFRQKRNRQSRAD